MYNIHVIKLCRIVQCTMPVRNTLRVPDAVPRHRDSQWRFVICCVDCARYLFNCPDIILYHQCIKLSLMLKCVKFHVIQDSKMSLRKNVNTFWLGVKAEYPIQSELAMAALLPFVTTDLFKSAFSTLTALKTKHRSSLKSIEFSMRPALTNIKPLFEL